MKKRILLLLSLVAALCCLLCACGEGNVPIDPPDPGLALNRTSLTLMVGAEEQLVAIYEGKKEISWTCSDETVVSVEPVEGGAYVTGLKVGTATVTASFEEVNVSCTVTVKESPLSIFLPDAPTGSLKNGRLVLVKNGVATVRAFSEIALDGDPVWTVDDESIASVEWQGLIARVTALKRGICTITLSCDGYSASFTLYVGITGEVL